MNSRAVVTELAAKIRGPNRTPDGRPIEYSITPVGPGQLGGFMAEVVFKFEEIHPVGKSKARATKTEAQEEAYEAIRADIQGIWDMRSRVAEEKLQIPCLLCLELLRPRMMGEHMMYKHSEHVIEASGRAGDATYQKTVTAAIERMEAHRQQ